MTDVMDHGFVRDQATGALAVAGPGGADVAKGRLLAFSKKTNGDFTSALAFEDVPGMTSIPFTVPPSGQVEAIMSVIVSNDTAGQGAAAKIVDTNGAVDKLITPQLNSPAANAFIICTFETVLTGLTPGAALVYKMQFGRFFSASGTAKLTAQSTQPATVLIKAA